MPTATDEELDAACLRMQPAARAFVAAVRDRDPAHTRAAFAGVHQVETPLGRSPLGVLALVLAEELIIAETVPGADRVALAANVERERCLRLATFVAQAEGANIVTQARRLPARIASGARP